MIDLGIFVVTLKRRRPFFARLMRRLEPQLNERVAVYTLEDEGRETIGAKRQRMLEEAPESRWCAFVDDDDLVAPTYCASILKALDENPDVVGFKLRYYEDGKLKGTAFHSLEMNPYRRWQDPPIENGGVRTFYRTPNHLNPVRREMALSVGFKPLQSGEDADYSKRLEQTYPTMREQFVDEYLYSYFYRTPQLRKEGPRVKVEDVAGV